MGSRLDLHNVLLGIPGLKATYFQPPSTVKLSYPCIIYKIDDVKENFADNILYYNMKRYLITIVDINPDSTIPDELIKLRYCSFESSYAVDNLNHFIYSLYF